VSTGCGWAWSPDMEGSYKYMNKQSQKDKGWSTILGIGHGVKNSSPQEKAKKLCFEMLHKASDNRNRKEIVNCKT
jgi:hypothetical protein